MPVHSLVGRLLAVLELRQIEDTLFRRRLVRSALDRSAAETTALRLCLVRRPPVRRPLDRSAAKATALCRQLLRRPLEPTGPEHMLLGQRLLNRPL